MAAGNIRRHIILLFSLQALVAGSLHAQKEAKNAVTVKISISRNPILLGEQTELQVSVDVSGGKLYPQWNAFPDTLNHLEILKRGTLDSIRSGADMRYTQSFVITGFDSGHWVIPPIAVKAGGTTYYSDTAGINVTTVELRGKDYNDIREIIDVKEPKTDWAVWLPYILGTVLALALFVFWMKNRKRVPAAEKPVDKGTAYELALKELKVLSSDNLPAQGEMKAYYTRLYDILRRYLSAYSGRKVMNMTTDDLLMDGKEWVPVGQFSRLAEVVRISDAVKFARYLSSVQESGASMETVRETIESLNRQKS